MLQRQFTIGNAIYLSIALGMISATAMNFLIDLIFDHGKDFYFRLIVVLFFIFMIIMILTSNKFRSILRVWNNFFPLEDKKNE